MPTLAAYPLLLVLCWLCLQVATGQPPSSSLYFVSSSLGSDANDGRSPERPWATVTQLSNHSSQLQPGDTAYICNSDSFFGQSLHISDTRPADPLIPPPGSTAVAAVTISGEWDCRQPGLILSNASYPLISPSSRSGGDGRSGWVEAPSSSCSSASTAGSFACVLQLDMSSLPGFSVSPSAPPRLVLSVWVDGYRFVQARTPNLLSIDQRQGVNRSQNHGLTTLPHSSLTCPVSPLNYPSSPLCPVCTGEFMYVNGTASNSSVIVSPSLASSAVNAYVNATIRIRTSEWTWESRTVVASSSTHQQGSLTLSYPTNYAPSTVYEGRTCGFYLEAGPWMPYRNALPFLDLRGEWWFDAPGNLLFMNARNGTEAAGILSGRSTVDVVLDSTPVGVEVSGLTRYSLSLSHFNVTQAGPAGGVHVSQSANVTRVDFHDVHVSQVQGNGWAVGTSSRASTPAEVTLTASTVSDVDSNCVVVYVMEDEHPPEVRVTVADNVISRCGMAAGLGVSGDGGAQAVEVEHTLVTRNRIDTVGYIGVRPAYYSVIDSNNVSNVMLTLNDGASLYVWGAPGQGVVLTSNLLINSTGNTVASPASYATMAVSLYLDDGDVNTTVTNNTALGARSYCLFLHNTRNASVEGNTCWDGGIGMQADRDDLPFRDNRLARNVVYRNGSRSLNTVVTPFVQLSTKYGNVSGWFTSVGGRYCDGLGVEERGSTHLFELGLEWHAVYYDNVTEWREVTRDDPDDSVLGCGEVALALAGGGFSNAAERWRLHGWIRPWAVAAAMAWLSALYYTQ